MPSQQAAALCVACGAGLTLPRVREVGDGLGHDDGHVDTALDAVHAKLDEDVVKDVLHDIPAAHDAGAGLEGVADVPPRGGVGVAVLAGKGEGLVRLPVPVLGHDGWDGEPRSRVERPARADGRGACTARWRGSACCGKSAVRGMAYHCQ